MCGVTVPCICVSASIGPHAVKLNTMLIPSHIIYTSCSLQGPYPSDGGNVSNWNTLEDAAIDTVLLEKGCAGGTADTATAISKLADEKSTCNVWTRLNILQLVNNTANVGAVYMGDEVDSHVDNNMRVQLEQSRIANTQFRSIPTFQGSKTNHNIGVSKVTR